MTVRILTLLVSLIIIFEAIAGTAAEVVAQVQYPGQSCDTWERECTRLYGPQTERWYACMDQPRAKYDCEDAAGYAGYPPQETAVCDIWRRECARLYGSRTRKYRACMRQPQALVDCGPF
jgi:hypothetical protein